MTTYSHHMPVGPASNQTDAPWARRREPSAGEANAAADRARRIERLRWLATLMDSVVEVPGTKFRVGLDALVGLVPGAGDIATTAISAYILYEARNLGATRSQLARMGANVLIDFAVGAIPILGDIFDLAFKANIRNLKILGIEPGVSKA